MVAANVKKRRVKGGTSRKAVKKQRVNSETALNPAFSYTSEQLCRTLGVDRTSLWRWKKLGLTCKRVGHRDYYLGADVQKFMFG